MNQFVYEKVELGLTMEGTSYDGNDGEAIDLQIMARRPRVYYSTLLL
jgi:hypothetical protein